MKLEPIKNDGSFALSTSNLPKQGVAVILKSTENQANIKDCSAAHAFSVKKQAETALPVWSNKCLGLFQAFMEDDHRPSKHDLDSSLRVQDGKT